ncbi:DMT family transporter [Sphingobacterium pedocola]|uniref:EamA family transporter n=1 Tax=Sphingobacterium pedocola TaxID=2082722 RepID=A0ABR9TD28_9SPHI|nr:DMT family transporter [Sphingobacterium pedocola]MBE8723263.1 EamA family transporter [Sphingobacterium pedocola]
MKQHWKLYALTTIIFWGIWGAFIEIPEKAGFPATLGYSVWALTMIPCAIVAIALSGWKLDFRKKSIIQGCIIGLTGAGGQLLLFEALKDGPAYLIFPIISLNPVITVVMSTTLLKETTTRKRWTGIILAFVAILFLSYQESETNTERGYVWLALALAVSLMWGIQAFVMKSANNRMSSENIFFYMTLTGLMLIPIAVGMTDFKQPINWGLSGPYLAAGIQILNAIGALTLVYALRYGKAIIVVPAVALAPVITIVISLIWYATLPHWIILCGLVLAVIVIYILAEE